MKLVRFVACSLLCFQHGQCDLSSLFKGRWVANPTARDGSYFQVNDTSIFAVKKNAKLSMEIQNIQQRHGSNRTVQFEMTNLRIHSVPMIFNILDYKIVSAIRLLMRHGLTLEFEMLSSSSVRVHWAIKEKAKDHIHQKGQLVLNNADTDDATATHKS